MDEFAYSEAMEQPGQGYGRKVAGEGGQIPRDLERQTAALEQLHGVIGELEARTDVVRLGKPERAMDTDAPQSVRSALGNEISSRTAVVESATRRLQTILHELEL